jgi:hypothetical protein
MKNFKTDYENRLDIIDYAIPNLETIAYLILAKGYFAYEDSKNEKDIDTAAFLSDLLLDTAKGIKERLLEDMDNEKRK